ncbi:GntR family transcriptional regulator [Microbacterium sp.]|uniref:GntR family transcriptional regulator n=1 Tax=Microbacterium sp. TaxID=51671 RepID=UPI003C71DD53
MNARELDRSSSTPLYGQIADDLESQLGEVFAPGDLLPSEAEIAESYAVNRLTVRDALALLARRGLVQTLKGKGTFAALPVTRFPLRAGDDASLTAAMAGAGRSVENVVRNLALISDEHAQRQRNTDRPVFRFESVRYVDDAPWSVTLTWIDPARFPAIDEKWTGGSLHAVLREHYGVRMRRGFRTFSAHTAEPAEAEVLLVPVASPVLQVGGVNVDENGVTVTVNRHRFRGDRIEVVTDPD